MSKLVSTVFVCTLTGAPDLPDNFGEGKLEDGHGYCAVGQVGDRGVAAYQFTAPAATIAAMRADKGRWADPESDAALTVLEKCPKCKQVTDKQDWKDKAKAKQNTLAALGVTDAEYARATATAAPAEERTACDYSKLTR